MSWNIIEDWESQEHMDKDQTIAYFEGLSDDVAGQLEQAFGLLSGSREGEVRRASARLVRALLLHSDAL